MGDTTIREMGLRLAMGRKKAGLTQEDLANQTGLSVKMISAAENGHKAMRPENIVKVCHALSISADYLLTGELVGFPIARQVQIEHLSPKQRTVLVNIINEYLSAFEPYSDV